MYRWWMTRWKKFSNKIPNHQDKRWRQFKSLPVSSCSFANAEVVHRHFSTCSHSYQQSLHQHPLTPLGFHHSWVRSHSKLKELYSQQVCTAQNLTASCDHFYPIEDCQVWYLCIWRVNSWKANESPSIYHI